MAEKPAHNASVFSWIYGRQLGGFGKKFLRRRCHSRVPREVDRSLWKSICRNTSSKSRGQTGELHCGGVFGLKYSPNGEVLVAACDNKCLILMDPVTESVVEFKENAHDCCCNNICFLDDRTFASCSDDCTVAVWDIRNLTSKVFALHGHDSWVKNVEIHKPSRKLISSSFDGTIRSWDLNAFNIEGNVESDILLRVQGLFRMKLSPLGDSMYISSSQIDEVIGIHHLDLCNLAEDIGFVENLETAGGVRTKRRTVILPNFINQCFSILERNNIDIFCRDFTKSIGLYDIDRNFLCYSIDVHPRNSAVLLYYMSGGDNLTTVHNTKRQYHSYAYEMDDNDKVDISHTRGLLTNYLSHKNTGSGAYVDSIEVSFSHCGRLVASPLGHGAVLATFDEEFSDFETLMTRNVFKGKRKPTGYVSTAASVLNVVQHCLGHRSNVLSTCFSPTHIQLATGSEEGLIALHNPELGACQTIIAP